MKRRRDRSYWIKLLEEAKERHYTLLRKLAYLDQILTKYPLKPLNRRMWGRVRQGNSKARRVSFAKFKLIHRVRSTSMAKTQRSIAKVQRQMAHYRAMIEQTKQRDVWWWLKHPLV